MFRPLIWVIFVEAVQIDDGADMVAVNDLADQSPGDLAAAIDFVRNHDTEPFRDEFVSNSERPGRDAGRRDQCRPGNRQENLASTADTLLPCGRIDQRGICGNSPRSAAVRRAGQRVTLTANDSVRDPESLGPTSAETMPSAKQLVGEE